MKKKGAFRRGRGETPRKNAAEVSSSDGKERGASPLPRRVIFASWGV
jgi:hypothetical protein